MVQTSTRAGRKPPPPPKLPSKEQVAAALAAQEQNGDEEDEASTVNEIRQHLAAVDDLPDSLEAEQG